MMAGMKVVQTVGWWAAKKADLAEKMAARSVALTAARRVAMRVHKMVELTVAQ